MDDKGYLVVLLLMVFLVLVTGLSASNGATKSAVENCIKAHSDWSVTQANNYCNTVIREGKLP